MGRLLPVVDERRKHEIYREERIADLKSYLRDHFPAGSEVGLELGCGHGHWLTALAESQPERYLLGADLITNRIERAQIKQDKRSLRNLHFKKAEAYELLEAWPDDLKLSAVFMLFPDPWPKKKHFKNRMVQPQLLDRLSELMAPGARFHFRTDHDDYFEWTLDIFGRRSDWEINEEAEWPLEVPTVFQKLMTSWNTLIAERSAH